MFVFICLYILLLISLCFLKEEYREKEKQDQKIEELQNMIYNHILVKHILEESLNKRKPLGMFIDFDFDLDFDVLGME